MTPRQRAGLQRSIRRTAQLAAVGLGAVVLTERDALRTCHQYRRETIYAAVQTGIGGSGMKRLSLPVA